MYEAQGEHEKALRYYNKALDVVEKVLGSEHPNTAATYINMAEVYQAQGKYEKALEHYEKALTVFMARLGENHPYTQSIKESVEIMKLFLVFGLNAE